MIPGLQLNINRHSNVTQECAGLQVKAKLRSKIVKSLFDRHSLKIKVHSLYKCINKYQLWIETFSSVQNVMQTS